MYVEVVGDVYNKCSPFHSPHSPLAKGKRSEPASSKNAQVPPWATTQSDHLCVKNQSKKCIDYIQDYTMYTVSAPV